MSTTSKGYMENREEFLAFPYELVRSGGADLATVYNAWTQRYDNNTHYLWEALNEMHHAGIIEAEEFLGSTQLSITDRYSDRTAPEMIDELPRLSGEYTDGVWARSAEEPSRVEVSGVELPDLPWDIFEEHADRHGYDTQQIHRGEMEGVVAEKESESGDKLTRYGVINGPEGDRIGLGVLFRVPRESAPGDEQLFSERHRQNYLDRIWEREINPMRQRTKNIYSAAESAVEDLEPEDSYRKALDESLRRATSLGANWSDPVDRAIASKSADFQEQVDRLVELYYPEDGGMNDLRPEPVVLNWSELVESDLLEKGVMPLGESLRETETAEGNRRRNRLYLEKYLETAREIAEHRDERR